MDDEDLLHGFEYLWTTKASEYALIQIERADKISYAIYNVPSGTALIIEENDVSRAVIEKMRATGIPIISQDEFNKRTGR
jgi:hypothetical protein